MKVITYKVLFLCATCLIGIACNGKGNESRCVSAKEASHLIKRRSFANIYFVKNDNDSGGNYRYSLSPYNNFTGFFWIGKNTYPRIVGRSLPVIIGVNDLIELNSEMSLNGKATFVTQSSFAMLPSDHKNTYRAVHAVYPLDRANIVQVNGITHNVNEVGDYTNAVDFEAEFGSDVHASTDGIVVHVEARYPDSGCYSADLINDANQIIILSKDGHEVVYGHLKQGSSKVVEGENVTQGQLIAQVGNSGFSGQPHLHLHAGGLTAKGYQTLPLRFSCRKHDKYQTPETGKYSCKL